MINVGIVGVSGYTGQELIRILLKHPKVKISGLFSSSLYSKSIQEIYPEFSSQINLVCSKPDPDDIIKKCDLVFLALPHTHSMEIAAKLLKAGKSVIDLSADYRIKDIKIFEEFYKHKHKDKPGVKESVYGLPELNRAKIKHARLVANPGCYPTAAILSLAPLIVNKLIDLNSIIIDAKSGVSGAGKKLAQRLLSCEGREDFKAYKVGVHQHTPEINQELSNLAGKKIKITFVPHLLPINRGILETVYIKKTKRSKLKTKNIVNLFKKFYKDEPFVRIKKEGEFPNIKDVVGTNFCDIGIRDNSEQIILICVIDNLLKGASGQAVQNMNIMYKFGETTGLV